MSTILSSDTLIGKYTQQALSDKWVEQAYSTPMEENPFFADDSTNPRGRRGSVEFSEGLQATSPEGITFLGGLIVPPGSADSTITRTIIGQSGTIYFAPFANLIIDNTTTNSSLNSNFPGGYALTPQHRTDLNSQELTPRDPSNLLGKEPDSLETLLDVAQYLYFAKESTEESTNGLFFTIDDDEVILNDRETYQQATANLSYADLPRSNGSIYSPKILVTDPDLGKKLDDSNPANDKFPRLAEVESQLVPFVQAGYYFAFTLDSGSHTLTFGDREHGQSNTYNILNPVYGTDRKDHLHGTAGDDYIDGGKGEDRLLGLLGDDLIVGGRGNDVIDGGPGDDELWGDEGYDTFVFRREYGRDMIYDFRKEDKIDIGERRISQGCISPVDLPNGLSAVEIQFGGDDVLTLVNIRKNQLRIGDGFITLK